MLNVAMKASMVLGTAQWGMAYGVTNDAGRISDSDLNSIVDLALAAGVSGFDTAVAYGDAQVRLRPWATHVRVTTKVAGSHPDHIRSEIFEATQQLGVPDLDACLIHDWDLLDPELAKRAARCLEAAREEGLVRAVGVSVYGEGALESADRAFSELNQVQVPANVLDRRLDDSLLLHGIADRGGRVQVRSALLQGLLAGPSQSRLSRHPAIQAFFAHAANAQVDPIALALAHVRALPWASEVVVGVTSAAELAELVAAWNSVPACVADRVLGCADSSLIDPREWVKE